MPLNKFELFVADLESKKHIGEVFLRITEEGYATNFEETFPYFVTLYMWGDEYSLVVSDDGKKIFAIHKIGKPVFYRITKAQ